MRHWAEAAIGRRHLGHALRTLGALGYLMRDALAHDDSAQHGDRILVGPHGVYVVGFRSIPGNVWRPGRQAPIAQAMAEHAQATERLAELLGSTLQADLARLHVRIEPLITVIGPEQSPGTTSRGVPVVGPGGLVEHLTSARSVLHPMQVEALMDRVDDWLALRRVAALQRRRSQPGTGRDQSGQ